MNKIQIIRFPERCSCGADWVHSGSEGGIGISPRRMKVCRNGHKLTAVLRDNDSIVWESDFIRGGIPPSVSGHISDTLPLSPDEIKAVADGLSKMSNLLKDTGYALGAVYLPFGVSGLAGKWIVETVDEQGYVWEHEGETLGEAWAKVSEWPGNAHNEGQHE